MSAELNTREEIEDYAARKILGLDKDWRYGSQFVDPLDPYSSEGFAEVLEAFGDENIEKLIGLLLYERTGRTDWSSEEVWEEAAKFWRACFYETGTVLPLVCWAHSIFCGKESPEVESPNA